MLLQLILYLMLWFDSDSSWCVKVCVTANYKLNSQVSMRRRVDTAALLFCCPFQTEKHKQRFWTRRCWHSSPAEPQRVQTPFALQHLIVLKPVTLFSSSFQQFKVTGIKADTATRCSYGKKNLQLISLGKMSE